MARARGLPLAALVAAALLAGGCGGKHAAVTRSGGCENVAQPAARPSGKLKPPSTRLDPAKTWVATVTTSCGSFRFALDVKDSPRTTASFAALANGGFFDGMIFHRIVPGFVIQGGDPTQTGEGGPGYSTRDVPPPKTTYARGDVAMAKTQLEAPGTAGSQFFVVTGDASFLPPDYALLGRVTSGMPVAQRIARLGNGDAGVPTRVVVMKRIRVAAQ